MLQILQVQNQKKIHIKYFVYFWIQIWFDKIQLISIKD